MFLLSNFECSVILDCSVKNQAKLRNSARTLHLSLSSGELGIDFSAHGFEPDRLASMASILDFVEKAGGGTK